MGHFLLLSFAVQTLLITRPSHKTCVCVCVVEILNWHCPLLNLAQIHKITWIARLFLPMLFDQRERWVVLTILILHPDNRRVGGYECVRACARACQCVDHHSSYDAYRLPWLWWLPLYFPSVPLVRTNPAVLFQSGRCHSVSDSDWIYLECVSVHAC